MQNRIRIHTAMFRSIIGGALLGAYSLTAAADLSIPISAVTSDGVGKNLGKVDISESPYGVIFNPSLHDLPPGLHGFHVHENPDCDAQKKEGKLVAAGAAGSHLDPKKNEAHLAPWEEGHLGDLPTLFVEKDGRAQQPVLAPKLSLKELKNRALVIHAGADNYSDQPEKLGGGGERIACGVIGKKL